MYRLSMNPSRLISRNGPNQGMSLIVVLIMLVIIGITAASAMRSATSEQRATNNLRLDAVAQQYAEAALRFCEAQLQLASGSRVVAFQTGNIPTTTFALSGWEDTATWTTSSGRASATRYPLTAGQLGGSLLAPGTLPQCVVENQTMGSPTFNVTVVTARGFSPDYSADSNGKTTSGSVVWLQSILNANL